MEKREKYEEKNEIFDSTNELKTTNNTDKDEKSNIILQITRAKKIFQ